jgi:hypothetical protein
MPRLHALMLLIKNKPGVERDRLTWKWTKGAATAFAEFGDPTDDTPAGTDFALCVYKAGLPRPLLSLAIPRGGQCAGVDCWRQIGTSKYKYLDDALSADGVRKADVKAGASDGQAKASVKGAGAGLGLPALPLNGAIRSELRNSESEATGVCWGAAFDTVIRRTGTMYKAKGE